LPQKNQADNEEFKAFREVQGSSSEEFWIARVSTAIPYQERNLGSLLHQLSRGS